MWPWRRSERRSAAWKLPCSDSETTNYPPLPGNRLKISRELIINTKYPNLHLCISWWRVNIMVNILVLVCSSILPSPEAVQSWIIILELESRSRSLTEQNSKFVIYHKFWYSRDGAIDTSLLQTLQWTSRHTSQDVRLHFNIRTFHLSCTIANVNCWFNALSILAGFKYSLKYIADCICLAVLCNTRLYNFCGWAGSRAADDPSV